jgi:hypothetical protein
MRPLAVALLVLLLLAFAPAPAAATVRGFTDGDYWAYADRLMEDLDTWWDPARGVYALGGPDGPASVRVNSAMLLTHALAAQTGYQGRSRHDDRARILVRRLTTAPAWLGAHRWRGRQTTCWSASLDVAMREHRALEPKVAEALAWAWQARRALGLAPDDARRIAQRVTACATSAAWRFPSGVLNQINWNAEMYASAVTVGAPRELLTRQYRRYLGHFVAGLTRVMPGQRTPNLGRGYQFHYRPERPDTAGVNLDSPEYANITVDALRYYDRALRLGMRPLPRAGVRHLQAWVTRLLAGSWTHAGYLNWDTGHGYKRWHSAQYWAFARQGLLAIATSPRFWARPAYGRWAKALFDRGLMLHRRLADEAGRPVAPPRMFGVETRLELFDCYCARMIASAARAVAAGLGSMPAEDPPPLYAFDYDTGRLAVTTPRYSTAIVPDNRGVFAYGGIEIARLFGPGQTPAANLGGTPPAAFGIVVTDAAGRTLLASQHNRTGRLRLLRSPHGPLRHPRAYPPVPYAGPFRVLETLGVVHRGGLRVDSAYRFERQTIAARWRVRCSASCDGHRVRALFPTSREQAAIAVTLRDGRRIPLAGPGAAPAAAVALRDTIAVELGTGYRVTGLRGPAGATLSAVATRPEPTNPSPGPSLAVELAPRGGFHDRTLSASIEPLTPPAP